MNNTLPMYVSQCTGELGNPEPDGFFGEGLARNVEAKIPSLHQVDDDVPIQQVSLHLLPPGCLFVRRGEPVQIFNILEAVAQVAQERML